MKADKSEDPQRQGLRERLETILIRTEKATSWHEEAGRLRGLVNREGYVPIRARLAVEDLDFLAGARTDLLRFSELGLRLLDLHQPRDAGGITSDAANPILRCRSCMWRWPCPTFRAMSESFGGAKEPADETADETTHETAQETAQAQGTVQEVGVSPAAGGGSGNGSPARR